MEAIYTDMEKDIREVTIEELKSIFEDNYKHGQLFKGDDGVYKIVSATPYESVWHHVSSDEGHDCAYWHNVIKINGLGKGESFIPIACMNCWKIVVRPKNIKQLFILLALQQEMNVRSKCGIETRGTVHGLYGGYFYTNSLEEGLERYRQVREKVDEWLGEDVTVLLKRGCTEYELAHGDSSLWKPYDGQEEVEKWIKENLDYVSISPLHQDPEAFGLIHAKWVKYAYANGDSAYIELTGDVPLYKAYRTYHGQEGS